MKFSVPSIKSLSSIDYVYVRIGANDISKGKSLIDQPEKEIFVLLEEFTQSDHSLMHFICYNTWCLKILFNKFLNSLLYGLWIYHLKFCYFKFWWLKKYKINIRYIKSLLNLSYKIRPWLIKKWLK